MAVEKNKVSPVETVESLMKEAEVLKLKLEDERQKLNDVTCKYIIVVTFKCYTLFMFVVSAVAERLEIINYMNIKPRRVLKGHQAKVLCSDWSPDKRHIVSSSQVGLLIMLLTFKIFT